MNHDALPPARPEFWRKCSSCKKPLPYAANYWVCNVSTCNRKRVGYAFCSVSCWDAHLPIMNHRESWAAERRAPSFDEWQRTQSGEAEAPKRTRAPRAEAEAASPPETESAATTAPKVILRRRAD